MLVCVNRSFLACFLLLTLTSSNAEDILGCGGFVKSKAKIDYSKVEVRLITPNGIQKYQTECAPNNGYYMVPFIENGDFILKLQPPNGWTFEPTSVNLHVDGINDPCSQGKDINFEFLGFSVSGQVKSTGLDTGGPAGVTLQLMGQESGKPIAETLSVEGGIYQFQSVFPGEYKIIASHKSYQFKQHEVSVTVTDDSVRCSQSLIVSGYDVQGNVAAADLPVKDVHLLLFSHHKVQTKVKGCKEAPPIGSEDLVKSKQLYFICSVSSDGNGHFVFPSLQPSEYVLVPFHKEKTIEFDVEPKEINLSVTHGSVLLSKTFSVTGFSVTGLVLDAPSPKGKHVAGAAIFVDGVKQAVTDKNGHYRLQSMTSGSYKISVKKDDFFFPISTLKIGSDTPRLPDIVAESFSLCGQAHIKKKHMESFNIQTLGMRISNNDGTVKLTKKLDNSGKFCFQQAPGDYVLEPIVPDAIKKSSIQFHPPVMKVSLGNAPKKDVEFHQVLVDVAVSFTCINGCSGATVEMVKDGEPSSTAVKKKSTNSPNLTYKNLLPGKYQFSALHEQWCWEQNKTTVDAQYGGKNSVIFKQVGFKLVCSVSHDVDVMIYRHEKPVNTFHLTKGKNQLCVAESGEYVLKPKSCHVFNKESFLFNTDNPQPILLQAIAHVVTVRIKSSHNDAEMKVTIKSNNQAKESEMVPELEKRNNAKEFSYIVEYKATEMEKLVITPSSSVFLFEPKTLQATVTAVNCDRDIAIFKAYKGLFIEGMVTPPIKDALIIITEDKAESKKVECYTDANGKYKYGPLNPLVSYIVTAQKEGYAFLQDTQNKVNFQARKYSRISFLVEITGEDQLPLKGVFITVSGGSFRSNNLTDSQGKLVLYNLEPGQYYFKAVMKEYEFLPSSKVVELAEGQELDITIQGKRVAYSCYGSVKSLNGQPESDVSIQAFETTGDSSHAEETRTDDQGIFRIKGLLPNADYMIMVKQPDHFQRFAPQHANISVTHEDITGLDFIGFRTQSHFEVSGNVITSNEYLKYLKVALYRKFDMTSPVATASLSSSPFFHFPPVPREHSEYQVVLEVSLDKTKYSYTEPAAGFYATGTYKHVVLEFHPKRKTLDMDTPQASYFTLPFSCLILLIAYNYAKVQSLIEKLYTNMTESESPAAKQTGRKSRKDK